jgi:hypothetical protein
MSLTKRLRLGTSPPWSVDTAGALSCGQPTAARCNTGRRPLKRATSSDNLLSTFELCERSMKRMTLLSDRAGTACAASPKPEPEPEQPQTIACSSTPGRRYRGVPGHRTWKISNCPRLDSRIWTPVTESGRHPNESTAIVPYAGPPSSCRPYSAPYSAPAGSSARSVASGGNGQPVVADMDSSSHWEDVLSLGAKLRADGLRECWIEEIGSDEEEDLTPSFSTMAHDPDSVQSQPQLYGDPDAMVFDDNDL